jgi:hypothetical protein
MMPNNAPLTPAEAQAMARSIRDEPGCPTHFAVGDPMCDACEAKGYGRVPRSELFALVAAVETLAGQVKRLEAERDALLGRIASLEGPSA